MMDGYRLFALIALLGCLATPVVLADCDVPRNPQDPDDLQWIVSLVGYESLLVHRTVACSHSHGTHALFRADLATLPRLAVSPTSASRTK